MKRHQLPPCIFWICIFASLSGCKKDKAGANGAIADESGSYMVSTFVGNGLNGNDPQTAGLALLYFPGNTATDTQGNLYVADGGNSKIRKVSPSGEMTNFAGSNTPGNADGSGASASFSNPVFLAIDVHDNLFVGDAAGLRIRKISSAGVVTTVAGNGTAGRTDGVGTAASVDIMGGIATDPQGNVYFTQQGFHGIRRISPDGMVTSFVGSATPGFEDGSGGAARFNEPYSLICDDAGYIYVSDHKNARIRKVSPTGQVSTFLKRNIPEEVHHITMDKQGNFYIIQSALNRTEIVRYDKQGRVTKIAGGDRGYQDGLGAVAKFSYASGLSVDASGNLYFTDLLNHVIRKITRL